MELRLSIVTISFNQRAYLPGCLDSVVSQLRAGDEYIVVDPGSTDGSREIIQSYVSRGQVTRAIFEKDRGPADGLNRGFAAATGDIFAYLNSDDFFLPEAFDFVRHYFGAHPEVDVLVSPIKCVDGDGRFFWRGRASRGLSTHELIHDRSYYVQQGTFFRAPAFHRTSGFCVENRTCWDFELIADLILAGARVTQVLRPLGAFRMYSESISGRGDHMKLCEGDLRRILLKARAENGLRPSLSTWELWGKKLATLDPVRRATEVLTVFY